MIEPLLLEQLRSLVGRQVEYSGHSCRIVEVLDSEHALVIRCEGKERVIQGNQFGEANRRVQLGLLVGEVIRQEKIELDQSLVDAAIEEMAVAYEQPDQVREYYRQNRQARTGIENMVLEDQVVNHILSKAKVTEKKASFEDLMNGNV